MLSGSFRFSAAPLFSVHVASKPPCLLFFLTMLQDSCRWWRYSGVFVDSGGRLSKFNDSINGLLHTTAAGKPFSSTRRCCCLSRTPAPPPFYTLSSLNTHWRHKISEICGFYDICHSSSCTSSFCICYDLGVFV
ncbi:hypothetical protein HanIR_Chr16g0839751 [Helianthus annuus]|nr:hypothetical protein HanIR_Chr16g0839751 [Helianthus annuus]